MFLYFFNYGDKEVDLAKISVHSDHVLHIDEQNKIVYSKAWFLIPIEISELKDNDAVVLSWTGSTENEFHSGTQSIKIRDLENVHKNLMYITFN